MRYLILMCVLATPAAADNVSPWFGSADQKPFQMAADGSQVAGLAIISGKREPARHQGGCAITGCSIAENAAKVLGIGHVSP